MTTQKYHFGGDKRMQNDWDIQNLADEYTESWYRYSKGIEYPYYRENEEDEEDEETE